MKILSKLNAITTVPMWFFNSFAGIVGGIWLLFQGNWMLVVAGIIALFLSKIYFRLSFTPHFGLMKLGVFFYEKKIKFLAWPIFYVATLTTMAAISLWVFTMFLNGAAFVNIITPTSVPVHLWCYGLATWPIQYMASKEPIESRGSNLVTIFSTFGAMWIFFAIVVLGMNFYSSFWGFLISMTICLNIMFYDVAKYEKFNTRHEDNFLV